MGVVGREMSLFTSSPDHSSCFLNMHFLKRAGINPYYALTFESHVNSANYLCTGPMSIQQKDD